MNNILEQLSSLRIIPVVIINNVDASEQLAQSLINGGLPCMEITFRTDEAVKVLERMQKAFPSMLLGAGTVLSIEQVKIAVNAGAKFIVSPGLNPKVVEYCLKENILITPGVVTPSDIERAIDLGLDVVKFFPAEACGGVPYLKAISAPYRYMKFIPTGGINASNVASYLDMPAVLACGGSWMVDQCLIANGDFKAIEHRTHTAVTLVKK